MTTFTFDENIVSDLYKDAFGYRPSSGWYESWTDMSDAEKQLEWDWLCAALSHEMEASKSREEAAFVSLMFRIEKTTKLGAADTVTALAWIIESEKFTDHDLQYGVDYFCYHFGLNYAMKVFFPIDEAIAQARVLVTDE